MVFGEVFMVRHEEALSITVAEASRFVIGG
jgi:hypothetical protein